MCVNKQTLNIVDINLKFRYTNFRGFIMKKLTLLQIIFCALVASSSTQALAGATNADGTTAGTSTNGTNIEGTTIDGTPTDGTTTGTPIVDDQNMAIQGTSTMNNTDLNDINDSDDGGFGWMGLIGLVGLAGLMKRDRVEHTKTITR